MNDCSWPEVASRANQIRRGQPESALRGARIAVNTAIWTDLPALPSGLAVDIGITRSSVAFVLGSDFKVWKWSGTDWVLVKQLDRGDRISTGGDAVYVASASTGGSQKVP